MTGTGRALRLSNTPTGSTSNQRRCRCFKRTQVLPSAHWPHQYSHRPVPLRRPGFATVLVARWIGIVSAAGAISPVGSSADGGSADTYRHTTTYGRAAVNTGAIGASAIANAANANVTNANAANASAANASAPTAICEGII